MSWHRASCARAVAEDEPPRDRGQVPSATDNQPRSMERDYDFVERPSQDFFCPVSLELLLEPQLTSCCGHHLSRDAATRLQREGKACPMCNEQEWNAVLDKYHRRRVHEVRVRCPHKGSGCDWVGEVNGLKRHADSCAKRLWECKYCGLKCTYGEGEGKHWPTCRKFPEPCPNRCEVGSVERCNVEQHRGMCSLEFVACEMKEFGCSAVVPRKVLATHMRESELQHLTAMAVLNLRLSRQLQQDSTERDRKIARLQQDMAKQNQLQTEMKTKMDEQKQEIAGLKQQQVKEITALKEGQKREGSQVKDAIAALSQQVEREKETMTELQTKTREEMKKETKQLQTEMKAKMDEQKQEIAGLKQQQVKEITALKEGQKREGSQVKDAIAALSQQVEREKETMTELQTKTREEMKKETKLLQTEMKAKMDDQKKMQTEMKVKMDDQKKMQTEMKVKMDDQKKMQTKMKVKMDDQKKMQTEMKTKMDEQKREVVELKAQVQAVQHTTQHIELHTAGGACSGSKVLTFTKYGQHKGKGNDSGSNEVYSDLFYSHHHGYKFKLRIHYFGLPNNDIGAFLHLVTEEYDDQLHWPVEVKVRLELLNQAGDHHHVERIKSFKWEKNGRNTHAIDDSLMKYSDLEKKGDGVQYMMNDSLKFRVHLTALPA